MRQIYLLLISVPLFFYSIARAQTSGYDKAAFYDAMRDDDVAKIDVQLATINKASFPEKKAFEGTLLMKKAGLIRGAGKKLRLFKTGAEELEAEIQKDGDNAEYRFCRLMIQEHAPGIVNYRSNLDEDNAYIRKSFKELSPVVQQAIRDYSKTSKVLSANDL